jgi:hypothetical protein
VAAGTISAAALTANSPQDIHTAVDGFLAQNEGTPVYDNYKKLTDSMMYVVDHAKDVAALHGVQVGDEAWRHAGLGMAQQALGAPAIAGAGGIGAPTAPIVDTVGQLQPTVQQPALAGGQIKLAGPPIAKTTAPAVTQLPSGSLAAVGGQYGVPAGAAPAPAQQSKLPPIQRPAPNAPTSDQQRYTATMEAGRQHYSDVSAAANDLQNGVGPTRYRNDQIQDILNSKTFSPTGPGAAQLNWISSKIPGQSGDAFQKIGHYLAQNSAAIAQKMGVPGTNMGAEQAAAASGSTSQNKGALLEITKVNDAMNTALDMYNRGLAKVSSNGADPSKVAAYRQAFGQNFDMNVLRYDDALRRNDKPEIDRIVKDEGPAGMKGMAQSRKVLHSLADTGDLP